METGLIIMAIALVACIGARLCFVGMKCNPKVTSTVGVLHVNVSDPKSDLGMYLTLNVPVEDIIGQKKILLDVNVLCENSQK